MPVTITRFEQTPNPNAVKCTLDRALSDRPRSFRSAEEASADPLARSIFELEGVTCLLISGDWMTVNKSPETGWGPLKRSLSALLATLD